MGGNEVSITDPDISGPIHPPKEKYSLPGPPHPPEEKYSLVDDTNEASINSFVCYALGNGNEELLNDCNKKYKVHTDTDSDGKTEIITDIKCKYNGKFFAMEVKVDPGSETNCIPLSHFRCLFPQLCRSDGLPKETALEPTLAQFKAYNGGVMKAHGWIVVSSQNISDNKFHPVRYYVVDREDARIPISHATATWLGLVKVLCTNKAPKCKRQVASVTRKNEQPIKNNSDFRTTTPSQREIFSERTNTPSQREIFSSDGRTVKTATSPSSKSHGCERKRRRGTKLHRSEEGLEEHPSVQ